MLSLYVRYDAVTVSLGVVRVSLGYCLKVSLRYHLGIIMVSLGFCLGIILVKIGYRSFIYLFFCSNTCTFA